MKTIIATTALALSLAAPAFADISNPQAFFALGNDSAAERVLNETSVGDTGSAKVEIAMYNDSVAEQNVKAAGYATRGDASNVMAFFAMGNDSAAEIN